MYVPKKSPMLRIGTERRRTPFRWFALIAQYKGTPFFSAPSLVPWGRSFRTKRKLTFGCLIGGHGLHTAIMGVSEPLILS